MNEKKTLSPEDFEAIVGQKPEVDEKLPQNLTRAGVIGGGTMGQGIAQLIASSGIDVILVERDETALKHSIEELTENMDREISRWGMTASEKRAILSRIQTTNDLHKIAGLKLVIEAVPEELALKKELFRQMDEITQSQAFLVSNTSTLSLTEIASVTQNPGNVIGMHFMNPVSKTKIVEVVRGLRTTEETFNYIKGIAERLNKVVVEVYEYPGYVTTRIIIPLLNEAMYVLMEGVASAEGIDTAMKLGYNFNVGPLEFADMLGLDEVMKWMETLFHELGDLKYRPCPLLRKMVRAGHLGRKTGWGFFKYDKEGRKIIEK
jgi:3-hydroxybutyryl-CoA dehydrogenase